MAKTFITQIDKDSLTNFSNNGADIIKKVNDLAADAIDKIVDLFENFDIESIDIANYDDFKMSMENYLGDINQVYVSKVELYEGTIYVYDEDGAEYTSEDWYLQAPQLLQELATCLEKKFNDIEQLTAGKHVRWIDPEIEDYDEDERQDILDRVFTIVQCPEVIERDSVILIANEETEAEVLPMELVLMPTEVDD